MATLYTQVDANTNKTWLLLSLFFIFILGLGWLFSYIFNNQGILFIAVLISIFSSLGSYWYSDKIVLALSNAQPITKEQSPELYRIVENLCITAGLPLPKIYLIDEAQPNAFATGRDAQHAVVAVTYGLLTKLNKTELEGVIAHELSHIGNRDILLSTIVAVMASVVTVAANFFLRASFWGGGRRSNDNNNLGPLLFLLGVVAAILAPFAATLIQLAISRKREFLADASSALLTRYPEGLASALEKISADTTPMRTANQATAHLYLAEPYKGKQATNWLVKLFMTHPPVEERIKTLREMSF